MGEANFYYFTCLKAKLPSAGLSKRAKTDPRTFFAILGRENYHEQPCGRTFIKCWERALKETSTTATEDPTSDPSLRAMRLCCSNAAQKCYESNPICKFWEFWENYKGTGALSGTILPAYDEY